MPMVTQSLVEFLLHFLLYCLPTLQESPWLSRSVKQTCILGPLPPAPRIPERSCAHSLSECRLSAALEKLPQVLAVIFAPLSAPIYIPTAELHPHRYSSLRKKPELRVRPASQRLGMDPGKATSLSAQFPCP